MNAFTSSFLSESKRPIFQDGEVEVKTETQGLHVYSQAGKSINGELWAGCVRMIMLTNLRLYIIVEPSPGARVVCWSILLSTAESAEDCALGVFRRSTRLLLNVRRPPAAKELPAVTVCIGLGFDRDGVGLDDARKDTFLKLLLQYMQRKAWLALDAKIREDELTASIISGNSAAAAAASTKIIIISSGDTALSAGDARVQPTTAGVGLTGILNSQRTKLLEADSLAKNAAQDMDSLMARAREVVGMVERYARYTAEAAAAAAAAAETNTSDGGASASASAGEMSSQDIGDMDTILQSIGMISPVTKFSAGRAYHEQLARQICDVLLAKDRLKRAGGMVTLTDLYCLYNRARGTELVSPDDLHAAVKLMGDFGLGMRLVKFPSGVLVVQSDQLSDKAVCARLLALFSAPAAANSRQARVAASVAAEGLQVTDVARLLQLSLAVAKEQLLLAEAGGALCRDESPVGVAYFKNEFFA